MSSRISTQRRIVYYEGHVQGVGFRQTTELLARRYAIAGYVQNLDDGRVKLVAQGTPLEIDRLEEDIQHRLGDFIRHRTSEIAPASEQLVRFEIKR